MSKSRAKIKWEAMWLRVRGSLSYTDVIVCDEWKDFNNFWEWIKPYYDKGLIPKYWHMDKDLLSPPDQKIYSPETCCFLPPEINSLIVVKPTKESTDPFHKGRSLDYNYSYGMYFIKKSNVGGKWLGYFYTKNEALEALCKYRVKQMKALVKQYEKMLDPNIIPTLLSWKPVYEM